jgi:hypothetical protein
MCSPACRAGGTSMLILDLTHALASVVASYLWTVARKYGDISLVNRFTRWAAKKFGPRRDPTAVAALLRPRFGVAGRENPSQELEHVGGKARSRCSQSTSARRRTRQPWPRRVRVSGPVAQRSD